MFNPDPRIELIPITADSSCVVIDNFLQDPDWLVRFASSLRGQFTKASQTSYPGVEAQMPDRYSRYLKDFFMYHVRRHFGVQEMLDLFSRISLVTLQPEELRPLQRICHRDKLTQDPQIRALASVLYLFRDPGLGGTSFYVPKIPRSDIDRLMPQWKDLSSEEFSKTIDAAPGYMTASNEYFELVCTIPAAWNRIIFYPGTIFHTGHITDTSRLSADPQQGRLTINSFFACR